MLHTWSIPNRKSESPVKGQRSISSKRKEKKKNDAFPPGTKGLELEAKHSPPSRAKVKMCRPIPPVSQHDFMAWCLVKHRCILTFTLLILITTITTLPCKKEIYWEASKKFSWILWRRPRPKLGCGAKERRKMISVLVSWKSIRAIGECTWHLWEWLVGMYWYLRRCFWNYSYALLKLTYGEIQSVHNVKFCYNLYRDNCRFWEFKQTLHSLYELIFAVLRNVTGGLESGLIKGG
jgi:hypothetical protein